MVKGIVVRKYVIRQRIFVCECEEWNHCATLCHRRIADPGTGCMG